jgi:hypothetical protein
MSAFYDLASVVLVPSGYKSGKIYAQKPLTTDGQLTFTRASTATRVNASGLIETVASGVPRLDYTNSSCPKLLLEPQRTNLNPYSEQFDNADWEKTNTTITANQAVSPDGTTNADAWFETSANTQFRLYDNGISVTSGTAYTCSLFVKANGRNWVSIEFFAGGGGFNGNRVWFNISNGTIGITQTGITAKIDNYGNGWYRIQATKTADATTTGYILYHLATADGVTSYAGDPTKGAFVYGGMTEVGAYATSYIPTLGTSVTRVADAASKTGISSLLGQTEGTIFVDFVMQNNATDMVPFSVDGSDGKLIWIRNAGAQFYGNGTSLIASIDTSAKTQGTRYKVAFVYGQNDFRLYRNGSLIGTDTSGTFTGTFSDISINGVVNQANVFNQILVFKTKLTNAQMAELTTL